jgi:hypothetical protein|tara:strand:+ start:1185 stop:1358 length:174 start_codon:yes stop_codon:yes gene_type:complete
MTTTETTGYKPMYVTELFTASLYGTEAEFDALLEYLGDPDGYDEDILFVRALIDQRR